MESLILFCIYYLVLIILSALGLFCVGKLAVFVCKKFLDWRYL